MRKWMENIIENKCIKINTENNVLIITLNNLLLSSYSYDELIDCDKKFKAFRSVEDIHSFIVSLTRREEIKIKIFY